MKLEYVSTARTQQGTVINILMYEPSGVKTHRANIETGASAEDVAKALIKLANEVKGGER